MILRLETQIVGFRRRIRTAYFPYRIGMEPTVSFAKTYVRLFELLGEVSDSFVFLLESIAYPCVGDPGQREDVSNDVPRAPPLASYHDAFSEPRHSASLRRSDLEHTQT